MGFALPNGAHVYLAPGYGPAITFTGATNAEHAGDHRQAQTISRSAISFT